MLSFSEIVKLKSILKTDFAATLHFHDVCPKPYFTLDKTGAEIQVAICSFLSQRYQTATFSSDGLHFTIDKKHSRSD